MANLNDEQLQEVIAKVPELRRLYITQKAQVFPVGDFVREEMDERGWSKAELVVRMGGTTAEERKLDFCTLEFVLAGLEHEGLLLGKDTADKLARAFGCSPEFFLNIDASCQEYVKSRNTLLRGMVDLLDAVETLAGREQKVRRTR